jgi:hypothetical protein
MKPNKYTSKNLNEKIFEQTLVLLRGTLTRSNFPQTDDALKAYVTNKYLSQMAQMNQAKVLYSVISTSSKKGQNYQCKWTNQLLELTKTNVLFANEKGTG